MNIKPKPVALKGELFSGGYLGGSDNGVSLEEEVAVAITLEIADCCL